MNRKLTSGLSQLELMVSLTIMGMIAVFLANAVNFSRQAFGYSRLRSTDTEMLIEQHALRKWSEDIPLGYAGYNGVKLFEGGPTNLRFASLGADDSLIEFRLIMENSNLEVIQRSLRSPGISEQTRHILARDISQLSIRYYGRLSSIADIRWHDVWSDPIHFPVLVKIEWETTAGKPVPPLTLQPAKIQRQRYMSLSSLFPPG